MSINPLNHYALENHPSIYDEESLTALELVARCAGKVNECVQEINKQDAKIEKLFKTELSAHVDKWLDEHPEATTTVLDGALTEPKFHPSLVLKAIKDYVTPQMFGATGNGVTDDTEAFQQALNAVPAFGGLYIPGGTYKLRGRVTLENVSNITIINSGVLMPVDGVTPWIGLLTLSQVKNAFIINLKMDGNVYKVPTTSTIGMQSLIRVANCENIVFENLDIRNACESAVTGEGNKNVTFHNVTLENLGEHGFYFGGTACHNMTFSNIHVHNIGQNNMNTNRATAVVKCRLHDKSDDLHTGYRIQNVTFLDDTAFDAMGHGCYHCVGSLIDCADFLLDTCTVKGSTTALVQFNALTETGTLRNIDFDGRDISGGVNVVYGTNAGETIEDKGAMNVSIHDSVLRCYTNMMCAFAFYNCDITCTSYMTSLYMDKSIRKAIKMSGCRVNVGGFYRLEIQAPQVDIQDTVITSEGENPNQPIFYPEAECTVRLRNVTDEAQRGKFIVSNDKVVNLFAEGCTLKGTIHDVSYINLANCRVPYETYINNANAEYSNVVRTGTGARLDIKKHTVTQSGAEVTADLRFACIKKLVAEDVLVIPTPKVDFTYTISDNKVLIVGDKGSHASVTYDVIVF